MLASVSTMLSGSPSALTGNWGGDIPMVRAAMLVPSFASSIYGSRSPLFGGAAARGRVSFPPNTAARARTATRRGFAITPQLASGKRRRPGLLLPTGGGDSLATMMQLMMSGASGEEGSQDERGVEEERTLLYRTGGDDGGMTVFDQGPLRCLVFPLSTQGQATMVEDEPDILQTCMYRDDPLLPYFDYVEMLLGVLFLYPRPREVLLIGLGGGSLAAMIKARAAEQHARGHPEVIEETERHGTQGGSERGGEEGANSAGCRITAVEYSADVLDIAERFFNFDRPAYHSVVVGDGHAFLQEAAAKGSRYDVIVIDAFDDGYMPPKQFMTEDFFHMTKSCLSPNGVLALNTLDVPLDNPRFLSHTTFGPAFGTRSYMEVCVGGSNRLLYMVNQAEPLRDYNAMYVREQGRGLWLNPSLETSLHIEFQNALGAMVRMRSSAGVGK